MSRASPLLFLLLGGVSIEQIRQNDDEVTEPSNTYLSPSFNLIAYYSPSATRFFNETFQWLADLYTVLWLVSFYEDILRAMGYYVVSCTSFLDNPYTMLSIFEQTEVDYKAGLSPALTYLSIFRWRRAEQCRESNPVS